MAMLGAMAFSGKAIIVKLGMRYGADAVTLLMLRMLFALPFFLAIVWWTSRPRAGLPVQPLRASDWWGIAGLGVTGYYLASYLDFAGLAFISASLERLILYLNPTLVLLLGALVYGRRIVARQAVGMAVSYCGVLLVFAQEANLMRGDVATGAMLVFGSAVSYALYLTYSGEMVRRLGSLRLVGLATTVACVLCIAHFALTRPLALVATLPIEVLWLSLLNALACTLVPILLVMMAIERVGAGLASQAGMVGPMSTIAMGVLVLGESFNASIVAGTLLVLAGVWVCSRAPGQLLTK